MADQRQVLGESVARLRGLVEGLDPRRWTEPSYCDDWTIAQLLSHIGSGAIINVDRLEHALGGPDTDPQPIWDEWNAKSPEAMVRDALVADQGVLDRLDALTDEQRADLVISFGPMELDVAAFVGFRVNEHVVHTWDLAVMLDPSATLAADALDLILPALPMLAGFVGKPTGTVRDVVVATTDPARTFRVALGEEDVVLAEAEADGAPDLTLPAEAFVRLVYGRLDPDHTPAFTGDEADLAELRRAFPGM
jgi:uncharacterized protein (TIGR03083 family)